MMARMNRIAAGIVLAVAVAGAAYAADLLNPAWRTIFPGDRAHELTRQCSRAAPGPISGTWTPSDADVAALEPELATLLTERLTLRRFPAHVADYYRQYTGLIIGGRHVIYVNGFHAQTVRRMGDHGEVLPPAETWRTQPVMICDGGPIVFGVEYDPATKTFAHFSFNGSI